MIYDAIVVGGGIAGCAAAITLARAERSVLLLEAGDYPRQKVCGEFVSAEALPLISDLLERRASEVVGSAHEISNVEFHSGRRQVRTQLPRPARSISREMLDAELWYAAQDARVDALPRTTVTSATRDGSIFRVLTRAGEFTSHAVVDASGRWSRLRDVPSAANAYIGLKAHLRGDFPASTVSLFFFHGGYCGVQRAGIGEVNVCALVRPTAARTLADVLRLDPALRDYARRWDITGATAVATAPVIPRRPTPENEGVLRAGDAAGFIDPFFGDGISIAVRSGALAAKSLLEGFDYGGAYVRNFRRAFLVAAAARRAFGSGGLPNTLVWQALSTAAPALVALGYRLR